MLFVIAAKFDMHDKLNVFSILISAPKILIHILATASSKETLRVQRKEGA